MFHQRTIRPRAVGLANRYLAIMNTQLEYLGASKAKGDSDVGRKKRAEHLTAIFSRALVLKGLLRAAPDYYMITWPKSGAGVNRDRVEELHPGPGEQEIVWGLSQLVQKRAKPNEEWEVVAQGKVLSRPMPVPEPTAKLGLERVLGASR